MLFTVSAHSQSATVITQKSNIREFARADADVVVVVNKGIKLKLLSPDHYNGWYNVKYGTKMGWIHGNNIKVPEARITAARPQKKGKDDWKYYATSNDARYYYNAGTMVRSGTTRQVWAKSIFTSNYETGSMFQYSIRCEAGQYRTLAGVQYYPSGTVKFSLDRPNPRFSTAIPETIMAALVEAVC